MSMLILLQNHQRRVNRTLSHFRSGSSQWTCFCYSKSWSSYWNSGKSLSSTLKLKLTSRQVFTVILNSWSDPDKANRATFLIGSAISILGAVIAWFMLEDVSRELDFEDQRWKNYLIDNGWEASWGDQETKDPAGVFKHTLTPTS